jgi:hypothetical protein
MTAMPSSRSSIATCLQQKPAGNGIADPRKKIKITDIQNVDSFIRTLSASQESIFCDSIQKPVATYDEVSRYRKAVRLNLFTALPIFLSSKFYHFYLTSLMSFFNGNEIYESKYY